MKKPVKTETVQTEQRVLGRRLAQELSQEELARITGGRTTCSGCRADDCGQAF